VLTRSANPWQLARAWPAISIVSGEGAPSVGHALTTRRGVGCGLGYLEAGLSRARLAWVLLYNFCFHWLHQKQGEDTFWCPVRNRIDGVVQQRVAMCVRATLLILQEYMQELHVIQVAVRVHLQTRHERLQALLVVVRCDVEHLPKVVDVDQPVVVMVVLRQDGLQHAVVLVDLQPQRACQELLVVLPPPPPPPAAAGRCQPRLGFARICGGEGRGAHQQVIAVDVQGLNHFHRVAIFHPATPACSPTCESATLLSLQLC
jgi:hypothetical protein